jgi:hypothetical protein
MLVPWRARPSRLRQRFSVDEQRCTDVFPREQLVCAEAFVAHIGPVGAPRRSPLAQMLMPDCAVRTGRRCGANTAYH